MAITIRRVLLIGIDGASWDIIWKLKRTEILSRNYIQGSTAWGVLESTTPPWSIPAWNSLFSGVEPTKLGIFSFIRRRGNDLVPMLSELNDQAYLWDLVSMYGEKVVAVNIPCVSKAIPVNGYFVASFLANRRELAWPRSLNEQLLQHRYIVDVVDTSPLTDEEYLETCVKMTIQRTALFLSLIRKVDWSLGIVVYTCSDRIQHRFLKTRFSFVEKYYEILDQCIAKLIDFVNISNDTIAFIVSDHGFKIPKAAFSVNTWLASKGFLSVSRVSIKKRIKRIVQYYVSNSYLALTVARRIVKILSTFLKRRCKDIIQREHSNIKIIKGAYMPSEDGTIYIINISKPLKKYLLEKIVEELNRYAPEVKAYLVSELAQVFREKAPDLILESDSFAFSTDPILPVKLRTMRATHSRWGVFVALGPRGVISTGFKGTLKTTDITPTILYCLNIFIPTYIDGHVITTLFVEELLSKRKPQYNIMTYDKARSLARIYRLKASMKLRS